MNALNDLSTEVRFRERMRGYDFEEVDSYVKAVSRAVTQGRDQISDLQQRLAQAEPHSGNGDGLSETREMLLRTLVLAQRTADTAIAEARTEAKSITDSAQERAAKTVAEAEAAANERLRSSEERAEQTLAEAEENCQLILSEAKRTAATELAVERARKIEEIEALEATRADLEAATAAIQARLDSERWQLRNLATSFQSFVEQFEPVTDPADPADAPAGPDGSALDMAADEATEPGEADPVAEAEDQADPDAQEESAMEVSPDPGDEDPAAEQASDAEAVEQASDEDPKPPSRPVTRIRPPSRPMTPKPSTMPSRTRSPPTRSPPTRCPTFRRWDGPGRAQTRTTLLPAASIRPGMRALSRPTRGRRIHTPATVPRPWLHRRRNRRRPAAQSSSTSRPRRTTSSSSNSGR